MPYLYENSKKNFADFEDFKSAAVKTINEIYGRVKPLDVFDFSETKDIYRAVAYYDHEDIPVVDPVGNVVNNDEADKARALEADNLLKAEQEVQAARARIINVIEQGGELSEEDKVVARTLGLIDAEDKYTLAQILKASDAAIKLAEEEGVDLKLVTGTGKDGNVTKGDVEAYLKALKADDGANADDDAGENNAPEEDNADDQNDQQQL